MRLVALLSTYNGAAYLAEQLDSLRAQTLPPTEVVVRDDGSTDTTPQILEAYQQQGALHWRAGHNVGAARSFWQLLRESPDADLYAFCDQDDVWDADKLACAVHALESCDESLPALYCCDVRVVDEHLRPLADRMVIPTPPDCLHALVRNLAPGCTYVFNRAAREMLVRYDPAVHGLELHDWMAYQIVACTGRVIFDARSHLSYRQHAHNAIGAVRDARRERLRKIRSFWSGPMRNSRERCAQRLEAVYGQSMTPANRQIVADFAHYRESTARRRRLLFERARIIAENERLAFRLLVLFGRL